MESQQVEMVRRNWLVNALIADGLEVGRRERDQRR